MVNLIHLIYNISVALIFLVGFACCQELCLLLDLNGDGFRLKNSLGGWWPEDVHFDALLWMHWGYCGCSSVCFCCKCPAVQAGQRSLPLFLPLCPCIMLVIHTCACRPWLTVHWIVKYACFQWTKQDYFTVPMTFNWYRRMSLSMDVRKVKCFCSKTLFALCVCTSMLFTVILNMDLASLFGIEIAVISFVR